MKSILLIGLGGAVGSVLRYLISHFFEKKTGMMLEKVTVWMKERTGSDFFGRWLVLIDFPTGAWGTISVNLLGCFFFGWLFEVDYIRIHLNEPANYLLKIGIFASFTTFSTFIYEVWKIYQNHSWLTLLFYLCIQLLGGMILFIWGKKIILIWQKMI